MRQSYMVSSLCEPSFFLHNETQDVKMRNMDETLDVRDNQLHT
jgi:hypothetical protein